MQCCRTAQAMHTDVRSTNHRTQSHWRTSFSTFRTAALSFALAITPVATAWADEDPIVLTNKDVRRLHAPATPAPEAESSAADTRVVAAPQFDSPKRTRKTSDQTMDATREAIDNKIESWQDEYYRLKTKSLQEAIARGDRINFGDAESPPASPAPGAGAGRATAPRTHRSACLYGTNGRLLHEPDGLKCPPVHRSASAATRAAAAAAQSSAEPTERVGCVYGSRGQVLHQPADRVCEQTGTR